MPLPLLPLYPHRRGLAFIDELCAALRTLRDCDVLDPRRCPDDLREPAALRHPVDGSKPHAPHNGESRVRT